MKKAQTLLIAMITSGHQTPSSQRSLADLPVIQRFAFWNWLTPITAVKLELRISAEFVLLLVLDFLFLHDFYSYRQTLTTLSRAAAYRDEETGAHVTRINHYCAELCGSLGIGAKFCDIIFHASPLHDIGKIATPDYILFKPGSFTPEEWAIMKSHTEIGAHVLEGSESP